VTSRRRIRRELGRLGWEVKWGASTGAGDDAVVGGYGPYRLSVQFDPRTGSPASLISHRAGEEGVFAQRWRGTEGLPTPEETVRQLLKRRVGHRPD
jgi:hypothetical protein